MKIREGNPRALMACVGEASRFQLVQALGGGARCVTDLAHAVGLSQSCTTRHLQVLERSRIISRTRAGKRVMYELSRDEPALEPLLAWVQSGAGVGLGEPAEPRPAAAIRRADSQAAPRAEARSRRARNARRGRPMPNAAAATRSKRLAPEAPSGQPAATRPTRNPARAIRLDPPTRTADVAGAPSLRPRDRDSIEDFLL